MNILYFSLYYPNPLSGGIERVTYNLSKTLSDSYGHVCYFMYHYSRFENDCMQNAIQIPLEMPLDQIREFIKNKNIQVIIVQGNVEIAYAFRKALEVDKLCKLFYVFHGEPLYPYKTWTIEYIIDLISYRHLYLYGLMRLLRFPGRKIRLRMNLLANYNLLVEGNGGGIDKFIFLSNNYIKPYMNFTGHNIVKLSTAIPNPLSFCSNMVTDIRNKEKRILIVARFEEPTKRLLHALRIWRILKVQKEMSDWSLDIVGDGDDKDLLTSYILKYRLHDIHFYGLQDPVFYYQRASIFMFTSYSECFPLTLLEAMQFGCVPVAFNSFGSISDIINNGNNGFIVKYRHFKQYAMKVLWLCNNKKERTDFANRAIHKSELFKLDVIARQWNDLLMNNLK